MPISYFWGKMKDKPSVMGSCESTNGSTAKSANLIGILKYSI